MKATPSSKSASRWNRKFHQPIKPNPLLGDVFGYFYFQPLTGMIKPTDYIQTIYYLSSGLKAPTSLGFHPTALNHLRVFEVHGRRNLRPGTHEDGARRVATAAGQGGGARMKPTRPVWDSQKPTRFTWDCHIYIYADPLSWFGGQWGGIYSSPMECMGHIPEKGGQ